jgi:hypothetical protein
MGQTGHALDHSRSKTAVSALLTHDRTKAESIMNDGAFLVELAEYALERMIDACKRLVAWLRPRVAG